MERTLTFIKPDGVKLNAVGQILSIFEKNGLKLADIVKTAPPMSQFEKHYAEHVDKDFFDELIQFSTSGPIVLMILEGDDVVKRVRMLVGATNPANALKGAIREKFGRGIPNNAIHASDSVEGAEREIDLWEEFFYRG